MRFYEIGFDRPDVRGSANDQENHNDHAVEAKECALLLMEELPSGKIPILFKSNVISVSALGVES